VAVLCEKTAKDNVGLTSLLGITDTIRVETQGLTDISTTHVLQLYLLLETEKVRGEHALSIQLQDPDGEPCTDRFRKVGTLKGDEDGWVENDEFSLPLANPKPGKYHVVVWFDEDVVGRVPLTIQVVHSTTRPYRPN
jgi:hypothetical protein